MAFSDDESDEPPSRRPSARRRLFADPPTPSRGRSRSRPRFEARLVETPLTRRRSRDDAPSQRSTATANRTRRETARRSVRAATPAPRTQSRGRFAFGAPMEPEAELPVRRRGTRRRASRAPSPDPVEEEEHDASISGGLNRVTEETINRMSGREARALLLQGVQLARDGLRTPRSVVSSDSCPRMGPQSLTHVLEAR